MLDFLLTDVRRIAEDDIKSLCDTEHPFGVKEICGGVLVVRIPGCDLFSRFIREPVALEQCADLGAEFCVALSVAVFGSRCSCGEVPTAHLC